MDQEIFLRIKEFIEDEARSCSMDFGCVTPQYVYRKMGGAIPIEEIEDEWIELRKQVFSIGL